MKVRKRRILSMRPELLVVLVLVVIFFAGGVLMLPPFDLLPGTHEAIQGHYRDPSGIDRDKPPEGRRQGRSSDDDAVPLQPHSDGIILTPIGLQVLGTSDLSISADLSGGAFEASFQ